MLRQFHDAVVDILQQQQQKLKGTAVTSNTTYSSHTISTTTGSSSSACTAQQAGSPLPTGPAGALAPPQTAFALPKANVLTSNSNQSTEVRRNAIATNSSSSSTCLVSRTDPSSSTALAARIESSTTLAVHSNTTKAVQKCWKAWQDASEAVRQSMLGLYDNRLARFYMWAQTECSVILAVHMPTGEPDYEALPVSRCCKLQAWLQLCCVAHPGLWLQYSKQVAVQ